MYILTKNFRSQQKLMLVIWLLSFRQRVTIMGKLGLNSLSSDKDDVTDDQILAFYNMATMTMLTGLEVYFLFSSFDIFRQQNNVHIFLGRFESSL